MNTTTHTVEAGYFTVSNALQVEVVQRTLTQIVVVITHNGTIWIPFTVDTTITEYANRFGQETSAYGGAGQVDYDLLSYTMRQALQDLDSKVKAY